MIVRPAARKAGNGSSGPADARKFLFAIRTTINVARRINFRRERQIVISRFVSDSQIATRLTPFRAVRRDASSTDTELREQMRQLVSQRALDLIVAVIAQHQIQRNQFFAIIRAPRRGSHSRIPLDSNLARQLRGAEFAQQFARVEL